MSSLTELTKYSTTLNQNMQQHTYLEVFEKGKDHCVRTPFTCAQLYQGHVFYTLQRIDGPAQKSGTRWPPTPGFSVANFDYHMANQTR